MFFPLRTDIYLKCTDPVIFCWEGPNVDIPINLFRIGFREEETSWLQKLYVGTQIGHLGIRKKKESLHSTAKQSINSELLRT
jgi:hypothetical protein